MGDRKAMALATPMLIWLTALLLLAGGFFFLAGTVGLLRFPDVHTRLHAVTKADNLGLGLVVFGLMLQAPGVAVALKLLGIWMLALIASATSSQLVADVARVEDGHGGGGESG
jgi:multicomponent Na+:H+ antiporter subunit G